MYHLKIPYCDIEQMPLDYLDWFYDRQLQELIDIDKAQNEKMNKFI